VRWSELVAETVSRVGDDIHAHWLCEEAGGFEAGELITVLDEQVTQRSVAHLDSMVQRYLDGVPIQYVLGHWSFRSLDLMVDERVLIPRPETEWVVEHALGIARARLQQRSGRVCCVDLGTGSGAIALSLASELPSGSADVWAIDVSPDAVNVARANLAGIDSRCAPFVRLAVGSWFDALPVELMGTIDLIVANPPYVAIDDEIDDIVRQHEPHVALFSTNDGLNDIRTIVTGAISWLAPGGSLVLEHGSAHGPAVRDIARAVGLTNITTHQDLASRDRFLAASRPS
jgi:release factor glutamine methyltransferase